MAMKKFINSPETITDEELVGLGLAFSDTVIVKDHFIISKDLENADRVTVVTYGGSGHEPAQKGYVGKGMLDIQVDGDIFAAPSGQLVFEAMKMADKGHGVLLLTLNYAGDQLAGNEAGQEGRHECHAGNHRRGDQVRPQRRRQQARPGRRSCHVSHCRRSGKRRQEP